jgi:branched-chain amino acid transport system substrate-binding protein
MSISRRGVLRTAITAVTFSNAASGETRPIRIGVITDMNGPYADFAGPGVVIGARLAAEEFPDGVLGRPIEILSGDHQAKPDVASTIARGWIDTDGVSAIVEGGHSGSALALQKVAQEKKRISMITGSSTSDLTNKACSPVGFHFNCDTFSLARSTGLTLTGLGGASWFFITVDYTFGHALERDTKRFVEQAGGKVLGAVRHPLGTTDFSSYLIEAQASGAKVIGFANAGADFQNSVKQAVEFGLVRGGQRLAALLMFITDVEALGLETAQGLVLTNSFYWDLNDATRAWTKQFRMHKDRAPTMVQAAGYACVRHYITAVRAAGSTDAPAVAAAMRAMPVNDMYNDNVRIRQDGRVLSKMYLMQVKAPTESAYRDDVYTILSTTPGEEAFRPLSESECSLVKQ